MLHQASTPPLPCIFIGRDLINQRVNNYLQHKHPLLSDALGSNGIPRPDTRSIWYSREHIETWLNEMNLMDADGMRVYLGAYGQDETLAPGQLCLLMVLTRAGTTTGSHRDIILENEPDFEARSNAPGSRSWEPGEAPDEGKPREYNYGAPCPPVCITDGPGFPE